MSKSDSKAVKLDDPSLEKRAGEWADQRTRWGRGTTMHEDVQAAYLAGAQAERGRLEKYNEDVAALYRQVDGERYDLRSENARLRAALEWYAAAPRPKEPGEVDEFGCGCCAGIYDAEGILENDSGVRGQRARKALGRD